MSRRFPHVYDALDIADSFGTVSSAGYPNGRWGPSRWLKMEPINPLRRLWHRARLAVGVFIGRYDALTWGDQ